MGFFKGIATGAMIGAAAGMLIAPQLDRGTRKRLKKSGVRVKHAAGDMIEDMMHWMK